MEEISNNKSFSDPFSPNREEVTIEDIEGGEGGDPRDFKNKKGEEQIGILIQGFDEMIKFMDFSFERAFQ
jgi:hypothetical protein